MCGVDATARRAYGRRAGDPRLMGEIRAHYNRGAEGPITTLPLDESWRSGPAIIAMVNGDVLAGGLGLMVACDLVIANEAARFGTTEINVGLWPMMITAELTRSVGRKRAATCDQNAGCSTDTFHLRSCQPTCL